MICKLLFLVVLFSVTTSSQAFSFSDPFETFRKASKEVFTTPKKSSKQNSGRSQELNELNNALEKYQKEIEELNLKGETLKKKITETKHNCDKEVEVLNQQHAAHMQKSHENQNILYGLLLKIKEEEEVHKKLHIELEKLSEILGLMDFQHKVMNLELTLARNRRENGTTAQCNQITIQLTVDAQENSMKMRSNTHPYKIRKRAKTSRDRQVTVLNGKVNMMGLMRDKVKKAILQSEKVFEAEVQNCHERILNLKTLMKDTKAMLQVQTNSIELLNKDLRDALDFSKSLRLEIEHGKELTIQFKKVLDNMRQESKGYKEDLKCFEQIKKAE